MKKLLTSLLAFFYISVFFAQSPQKMSYQAVIRNGNDQLVTNHEVGMRISILQGTASGTIIYQETYNPNPQTNANGLVSVEIGSGIAISGTFSEIDWSAGPYFLKTETDPNGGTDYSITGSSQILSVPYALYAEQTGNGFGGSYNELSNKPVDIDEDKTDDVTIPGDQTITGNKTFSNTIIANNGLNANNQNITNVTDPINAKDAVNKAYVDIIRKQINSQIAGGTVSDIDGNVYNTVRIGDQIWMAENLRTTKLNDGTDIFRGIQWYNNDEAKYKNVYGALYYRTKSNKICPTGWRMPDNYDWIELLEYLGVFVYNVGIGMSGVGTGDAGGKLKETGTEHWNYPNVGATDEVGFTALPGGAYYDGYFQDEPRFYGLGEAGYWWGSNEDYIFAIIIKFDGSNCTISKVFTETWEGSMLSIRCIKD